MNTIIQSIREKNLLPGFSSSLSLPLSRSTEPGQPPQPSLRRRLSSLSLRIQQQVPSPGDSWASFRRSRSVSSMGDYAGGGGSSIRKWWEQGWSWIMSRKPVLARDLEMSEEEGRVLGAQNKGSLRHVLFKVRSEIMKLVGSENHVTLPR
ncbi:hypothetical protein MLD38_022778 [Melastoma candidum]|uniref:Uncharacterized protein n=1 Tax=Melastoma candidum TaxID=119954 RepID=A0ACB9QK96_9MYRT|nr:hypothetical protein MLD38_022778 [Melastoma candidum]